MRLDIGIASYQAQDKLPKTIRCIEQNTQSDWRLLIVDNASPDPEVRKIISDAAERNPRIIPRFREDNVGYVGAVNEILEWAETPYVAYCDNDAHVQTPGWDLAMAHVLDTNHEVAMVFPGEQSYPIQRPRYTEILWGVGCFWMLKWAWRDVGLWDTELGHQEEVDYQIRLRLAGWRIAAVKEVAVRHYAKSSLDPASQERINQGVIRWVNKWVQYFCGAHVNYHSPNVLRFEDWPPVALYLEEYYQLKGLGDLNAAPEQIVIDGQKKDLIRVPRWEHLYRGRVI